MENTLNKPQTEPCTIHGVVCCAECNAMTDEQRWQMANNVYSK